MVLWGTVGHVELGKIEIAGAVYTSEDFLPIRAGVMLITSGVRALAWLKKKRKRKENKEQKEQGSILSGCAFLP